MSPFRFGVITSSAPSGAEWRARARQAEALGYSTLFMPDHFQDQWAPMVGLTIAVEATTTLRVGALVFDNDYRHPVVLAKEIATLDLATEGRVEFGLGAGWKRSDYDESGIAYDRPGVRIERMGEALTVMKALWSSAEPVDFSGAHYTIAGAVGTPRPFTRPHPAVCIGGGGRRILTLAAREATIVGINATLTAGELTAEVGATVTPAAFDEKVAWIRAAAGERFDDLELQCHSGFVTVGASDMPAETREIPLVLAGTVDELVDTLTSRRERYGISYWVVPDRAMDDFAPVVARLSGT